MTWVLTRGENESIVQFLSAGEPGVAFWPFRGGRALGEVTSDPAGRLTWTLPPAEVLRKVAR